MPNFVHIERKKLLEADRDHVKQAAIQIEVPEMKQRLVDKAAGVIGDDHLAVTLLHFLVVGDGVVSEGESDECNQRAEQQQRRDIVTISARKRSAAPSQPKRGNTNRQTIAASLSLVQRARASPAIYLPIIGYFRAKQSQVPRPPPQMAPKSIGNVKTSAKTRQAPAASRHVLARLYPLGPPKPRSLSAFSFRISGRTSGLMSSLSKSLIQRSGLMTGQSEPNSTLCFRSELA